MDEATMEQYADWLDNLERTDPVGYRQLIATMEAQIASGAAGGSAAAAQSPSSSSSSEQPHDADAVLWNMLRSATNSTPASTDSSNTHKLNGAQASPPLRFPGNKQMAPSGLAPSYEGIHIDVTPGFVIKTRNCTTNDKVFVNVCYSDSIQRFSEQKKLDDDGNEQDGLHVPLSLGAPHNVTDKRGNGAIAYDVAVNTQVVSDCQTDASGAFRHFVCNLAIEYIDQKYKVALDARYKLPRLSYCGPLPPPRHLIRKTHAPPTIQEIASIKQQSTGTIQKEPVAAVAAYKVYEVDTATDTRVACLRNPTAASGSALSPAVLNAACDALDVVVTFSDDAITTADDVTLELRAELLRVDARGYHELLLVASAIVTLDRSRVTNTLTLHFSIDKRWDMNHPDAGSTPWCLAQALTTDEEDSTTSKTAAAVDEEEPQEPVQPPQPQSLAERFHLERVGYKKATATPITRPTDDDDDDDDDELPEDKFHRSDMLSMHILEQRRLEKSQKRVESDSKRRQQRLEIESKQQQAAAAGKTWHEMFPHEPETTFVDMEQIRNTQQKKENEIATEDELLATDDARRAAAAWQVNQKTLDLQSALAFELLE